MGDMILVSRQALHDIEQDVLSLDDSLNDPVPGVTTTEGITKFVFHTARRIDEVATTAPSRIWYMIWATDRWNGEVHVELFATEEAAQQGALDFWNFQVCEPIEDDDGEVCAVDIETFDELLQRIADEGMDTVTIDSRPVQS